MPSHADIAAARTLAARLLFILAEAQAPLTIEELRARLTDREVAYTRVYRQLCALRAAKRVKRLSTRQNAAWAVWNYAGPVFTPASPDRRIAPLPRRRAERLATLGRRAVDKETAPKPTSWWTDGTLQADRRAFQRMVETRMPYMEGA